MILIIGLFIGIVALVCFPYEKLFDEYWIDKIRKGK